MAKNNWYVNGRVWEFKDGKGIVTIIGKGDCKSNKYVEISGPDAREVKTIHMTHKKIKSLANLLPLPPAAPKVKKEKPVIVAAPVPETPL